MKKLGIIQPGRIGDIIICLPIAKYYHDMGYTVIWPVDRNIIQNFIDYVPYVNFIPIEFDCRVAHQVCFNNQCNKVIDLSFTITGASQFNSDNYLNKQDEYSFDQFKYYLADVPFEEKWKLQIDRNHDREESLKNILKLEEKYTIYQDQSSDYNINFVKINHLIKNPCCVRKIKNQTNSVFDWIKTLQDASQHILIESCFVNLIDQLNIVVPQQVCLLKHGYYQKPLKDGHLKGIPRLKLDWIYE